MAPSMNTFEEAAHPINCYEISAFRVKDVGNSLKVRLVPSNGQPEKPAFYH